MMERGETMDFYYKCIFYEYKMCKYLNISYLYIFYNSFFAKYYLYYILYSLHACKVHIYKNIFN